MFRPHRLFRLSQQFDRMFHEFATPQLCSSPYSRLSILVGEQLVIRGTYRPPAVCAAPSLPSTAGRGEINLSASAISAVFDDFSLDSHV